MAERRETEEPRSILKRIARLLAFRIAISLAVVIPLGWWILRPSRTEEGPRASATPQRTAPATPRAALPEKTSSADSITASRSRAELRTVYTASENARALAKVKQGRLVRLADDAKTAIDAAIALARRFEGDLHSLLADRRGQRIAARQDFVERYRSVARRKKTSVDELTQLGEEVDRLSAPVRRAATDPDDIAVPDEKQADEIARILARADDAKKEHERACRELELLIVESSAVAETKSTLGEALAETERSELLDAERIVADARARANREAAETRAKAEAEAIRLAGEAEAGAILDAARRKKDAAEAEVAAKRASERKEALRRRSREPDVAHYLGAFLAKGYKQPLEFQGAYMNFDSTTEPKPVSFSRLKSVGALNAGDSGLSSLAWVASDSKNDRPHLRFGTYPGDWSRETREFLLRAQQLLRELGPTLVEEGRLAP